MKKAFIVTEGKTDVEILEKLLPPELAKEAEFVVGGGRYAAHTLASSILLAKKAPVALVLDADTEDETTIQEQREFFQESLGQAAYETPFKVFLIAPEIEVLFFESPSFIEGIAQQRFSPMEFDLAKRHPKQFLHQSLGKIVKSLDTQTLEAIRRHPLLKELSEFLSSIAKNGY